MSFRFGNTLFNSHHRMLEALAYQWWTADGANSPEIIDSFGCSDDGLAEADEAIEGWGLDKPSSDFPINDYDDEPPLSWMDENNTTREEIAEALVTFWRTRPDRNRDAIADLDALMARALQQGAEIGRILGESERCRAQAVTDWLRSTRR